MALEPPTVDAANPLYCPVISPNTYRRGLAEQLKNRLRPHTSTANDAYLRSLTQLGSIDSPQAVSSSPSVCFRRSRSSSGDPADSSAAPQARILPTKTKATKKRKRENVVTNESQSFVEFLHGPSKRAKSYQSVHLSSFDLSARAPRVTFFPLENSPRSNGREVGLVLKPSVELLQGPALGSETPRGIYAFIARLAVLLPGIRIVERLFARRQPTHQSIADFLGVHGYFNVEILETLRSSEITTLDLSPSMVDHLGLNLAGRDLLRVLGKPNSFLFVTHLSFSNVRLDDLDVKHFHHLPRLSALMLDNTRIGNDAVFMLACLKRTLAHLWLGGNSRIDDDSIPVFISLTKLRFLGLYGTCIGMNGFRRLARVVVNEKRSIEIEVTALCDTYIAAMDTKYAVELDSSFTSNPSAVSKLSTTELRRNLVAHATKNPNIISGGSKVEMVERLERILDMREADLLARSMVWGDEEKVIWLDS